MEFKKQAISFAAAEKKTSAKEENDKFFKEGVYQCVIKEVGPGRFEPKDPTWKNLNIKVEGTGGKVAFYCLEYPTENQKYMVNGKDWFFKFLEFVQFAKALGYKEGEEDELLNMLINKPQTMVGAPVKARFGYRLGYFARFIPGGEKQFHCVNAKTDKPDVNGDGTPMVFPSRDAVEAYCMSKQSNNKNYKYKAWPEPIEFLPGEKAKPAAAPTKKKVEELPF